jgi:hypothetical protein
MRLSNKTLLLLIVFLIPLGILTVLVTSSGLSKTQSQKPSNADDHKKVVEAIRRGGYREAAKLKGHYVGTMDPNWDWASFNLETLTKNSTAVIIGVPQQNKGSLSSSGDMITTDYDVRIEELIKGNFPVGTNVKVSLPGGRVDFEDGTSADLQTPEFERMVNGRRYVLFLYANRNGSDILLLTGGPQGLFELAGNGKIKAHGRATDPAVKEVQTKNDEELLNDLRMYSRKWPKAQGCCN